MHVLEPFYNWEKYYVSSEDERCPFYGKEYLLDQYSQHIYGYYIDPLWDYIGSETLYVKILYANYEDGYCMIELIGEWNDTLHNDIMYLKRNLADKLLRQGVNKFILIGENIMNFHGSDDCYYEEWFEDVDDGWVAAINFRGFVLEEMSNFNLDWYVNYGGHLDTINWRTFKPQVFFQKVHHQIMRRIEIT